MKREAVHHSKMKRLCRKLNLETWQAVGLLESIWHVTARQTPRGDIGKLSDEDIAIAIDYHGDERRMIGALVDSGWIDRNKEHRLIVHDWPDHAEDGVHMRIARSRDFFVRQGLIGQTVFEAPKLSRFFAREREPLREFYENVKIGKENTKRAHGVRTDRLNVRTNQLNVRTKSRSVAKTPPRPRLDPALTPPLTQNTDISPKSATSSSNGKHDDVELVFQQNVCTALGFDRLTKADATFCEELRVSGTTLESIQAGIIVGKARRLIHESNTGTTDPVRSLRYFAGTIEEASKGLLEPGYVAHTEAWLKRKAAK